ncbi:MAG TPA: hypothetical protein VMN78_08920 [Longimicrobiales bacterium]|nr:hypothetical protein [Longimicrobiales bacterium]
MNETDRHHAARPDPKRIRIVLRDHALLEARVHIAGGQFLITFLAGRKRYISLTDSVWMATEEPVDYMLLKVDRILWVSSPDQQIPLMNVLGATAPKQVEISVEGGLVIRGGLALGARQRLSDYLATAQEFIPLANAMALPREAMLGDIALNQDSIRSIREIRASQRPEEMAASLEADAS